MPLYVPSATGIMLPVTKIAATSIHLRPSTVTPGGGGGGDVPLPLLLHSQL